jgi:hypothetical protein
MKKNYFFKIALITLSFLMLNTSSKAQSFLEGFENPPLNDWTLQNNSTSPNPNADWGIANATQNLGFTAFAGTNYAAVTFQSTSQNTATGATISNWLIGPNRIFRNGDVISFYTRKINSTYQDRIELRLSTAGAGVNVGTLPTDVGTFTTLLTSVNPNIVANGYPVVWTQFTVTLSGLPANGVSGRFAFRYFVTDGGPGGNNSDGIGLDNVQYTSNYTPPTGACVNWTDPTPTTGWTDLGAAPCNNGGGCQVNEITAFQVWASEAYAIAAVQSGTSYTFSMCNGPGAGSWVPNFTIIKPDGAVEAFGAGAPTACQFSWTASQTGTYLIVINQAGNCGIPNTVDNGFPAITCNGLAPCPPSDCEAGTITTALNDTLCAGATYVYDVTGDTVPGPTGVYVLQFVPTVTTNFGPFTLTGTPPFNINAGLNGILAQQNPPIPDLTGEYVIRGFVARNGADIANTICSFTTDSVKLTFSPGPPNVSIVAGSNTTFCAGASVTLTATPGTNISWSNGTTGATTSATTSGSYTATISDAVGCTKVSNAIPVTVNPLPNVTVSPVGPITLCSGATQVLTANTTTNNTWSVTGQTGNSITVSTAGNYSLTHTDANGCIGTSNVVNVSVSSAVSADFNYSSATFCNTGANPTPIVVNAGGVFSSTPAGLNFVSTATGEINLATTLPATYTVTYTTPGACGEAQSVQITINAGSNANFSYANTVYCKNGTNPSPVFPVGSAAGNFTSSPVGLVFVAGTPGLINLANSTTGTYTITNSVSSSGICPASSATFTVTIEDVVVPVISANGPTTFCQGGSVTLSTNISTNIMWSDNVTTTPTLVVTQSGSYGMMTQNASGNCTSVSNVIDVVVNPLPSVSVTPAGPLTICDGQSEVLTSSATSGNVWNVPNQTSNTLSVGAAGNYSVTITDNNNCSATSNIVSVTITPNVDADFNYSSATFCNAGTNPVPTVVNAGGTFTSSPAGLTFVSTSTGEIDLANSAEGNYTVTYTTVGACPDAESVAISINFGADATFSYANTSYCKNATNPSPFYIAGASAGAFTASPIGLSFVNTNTGVINLTNSSPGVYTVTNTIAASGSCTGSTETFVVTIEDVVVPTISSNGSTAFCQGNNVVLTSSNTNNVVWSNNATTASITVSQAGTFTVTASNASGNCPVTSAPVSVVVNALPVVNVSPVGPISICAGQSQVLTANTVFGNTWNVANQNGSSLTVNSAGSYSVTHTDANGCVGTSNAVAVSITPTVSSDFSYSSATFCNLGANPVPTVVNSGGTFTSTPAGLNFVSASTGEINLASSTNGTYVITYTTSGTCPDASSITVNINSGADATFSYANTSYCKNATNPSPVYPVGASAGNYSATPAGLVFVNTNTGVVNLAASTAGTYTVTNTITSSGSCPSSTGTFTLTIEDISTPVISTSGPVVFCEGDNVVLTSSVANNILWSDNVTSTASLTATQTGTYSVTATSTSGNCTATSAPINVTANPLPGAPVLSQTGTVTICGNQSVTISTLDNSNVTWLPNNVFANSITVNTAGTYSAVVTNSNSCSNSSSVDVVVNPLPTAPVVSAGGPTTICANSQVVLTSSISTGILWSTGATTPTITVNASGNYSVTVTDNSNCSGTSNVVNVVVNPLPTAPVVTPAGPVILCPDAEADLTANLNNGITWSPTAETTPSIIVDSEGFYSATFTDNNGCSATSNVVQVIEDDCVGIDNVLFVNNFEVYPNPTRNNIAINFENSQSSNIVLRIISLEGKEIYSEVIGNNIHQFNRIYNFENHAGGIYILQLSSSNGIINKKIILQK